MPNSLRSRINKLAYQRHISREDAERIRDALAKQIPVKPYKVTKSLYHCTKCGTLIRTLDKFNDNYCDHCGQKIDWSEENEEQRN